jgi:protein-S-isoprenylcysteine O-methyltransferase Ste14
MTDHGLGRAALGSAAFFCIGPGGVAGLVPFLISGWRPHADVPPAVRVAGLLFLVAALLALLECFARFVIRGRGTPAPVAPPSRLVVSGLYRHVRNPMYVALVAIVAGQAAWFGSYALAAYAAVLSGLFHLRVLSYEEPRLEKQFGAFYEAYRAGVPRWFPRLSPWRPGPEWGGPEGQRS